MKNTMLFAALAACALLLLAERVQADQTPTPTTTLTFSNPEQAQCVADCLKQPTAAKATVRKPKRPAKPHKPYCPPCCVTARKEIEAIKVQIDALTSQIGLLGNGKDAGLQAQVDDLRQKLNKLNLFVQVALGAVGNELEKFRNEIADVNARLDRLEKLARPIRFSPVAGFLGLHSWDGTNSTLALVGVRFASSFTANLEVGVEPYVLLSGSERPFGTGVRGFLGLSFPQSRLAYELGFSGSWADLNSQAKAKALYLLGDLALKVSLYQGLWIRAGVNLGPELDRGKPSFALGGNALVGYEF